MDINDGEIDLELNLQRRSIRIKGQDYIILICIFILMIGIIVILIMMSLNEITIAKQLSCFQIFINESHDYNICE
jgi:hypothetical protein